MWDFINYFHVNLLLRRGVSSQVHTNIMSTLHFQDSIYLFNSQVFFKPTNFIYELKVLKQNAITQGIKDLDKRYLCMVGTEYFYFFGSTGLGVAKQVETRAINVLFLN